jgi:hypothetical protein
MTGNYWLNLIQQQLQHLGGLYHGLGQAPAAFHGGSFGPSGIANTRAPFAATQPIPATFLATLQALQAAPFPYALRNSPYEGIRAGEVIAWRVWRLVKDGDDWRLRSLTMDNVWQPGEPMQGDPEKGVGIFAVKDPEYAHSIGRVAGALVVVGKVALWGEIHEHERGYRGSSATAHRLDLVANRDLDNTVRPVRGRRRWIDDLQKVDEEGVETVAGKLAKAYGVECTWRRSGVPW